MSPNQPKPWSEIETSVDRLAIFEPLAPILKFFQSDWPTIAEFNRIALLANPNCPFKFVGQTPVLKPNHKSKDRRARSGSLHSYITATSKNKEVPTRLHSIHDLFNFITYVIFPKSKEAIMHLHALESEKQNTNNDGRGRTRLQDHLTLFDEGGAIRLMGNPEKFTEKFIVFGHGIYEQHIKAPRPIRAMTWDYPGVEIPNFAEIDEKLSRDIQRIEKILDTGEFSGKWLPPEWSNPFCVT